MRTYTRIITAVLLALLTAASVSARKRMLRDLTRIKGVTSVFVNASVLNQPNTVPDMVDDLGLKDMIKKLNTVEIVSANDSNRAISMLTSASNSLIDSLNMELLTEVNDAGQQISVYVTPVVEGTSDTRSLLMSISADNMATLINLSGTFDLAKLPDIGKASPQED
ncbi:MAG: DUF4252 domain-containing protein [Muribaculaceae bacterium]|uniref:DUF4252 domain-containing protein n=1 Tax=Paramuribaculum intestinale TaxID=2094151 RepID=UPI0025B6FD03|nr:DUF4252 domain-containing protein [Paramuribaculum intestinale]MCX4312084.1 DUF4252 domain-containing protein [Muribaculaceae bacterium]